MPAVTQEVNIRLNVLPGTKAAVPQVTAAAKSAAGAAAAGGGGAGGGLGAILGGIGLPALSVAGGIGAVGVGAPGVMAKFTRTLADIAGVIGQTLAPVLDTFTQALRLFGDVLASLLPDQQTMNELMEPVRDMIKELAETFKMLLPVLKPIIRDVLTLAKILVTEFAEGLKLVFSLIRDFLSLLGYKVQELRSSVGAAAGPATYTGIAELGRQTRLSAYGAESARRPEEETAKNTAETSRALLAIGPELQRLSEWVRALRFSGGPMIEQVQEAATRALMGQQ